MSKEYSFFARRSIRLKWGIIKEMMKLTHAEQTSLSIRNIMATNFHDDFILISYAR